ncbi:MAG: CCA tRNA nucleotidyltransferase [Erysipelothrix sp.]|nr:CCA tRNA nucleotidyltransferase [Erysipelothrix sp.]
MILLMHEGVKRLIDQGYEAYLVGGCVRDYLLGKPLHDVDITTNATPNEILAVFSDYKTFDVGIRHGTVGVLIDKNIVEITTYRKDNDYENYRRPKEVTFTSSLVDDLKRRDFTMNALAYNEIDGLIDCVNGQEDIKKRIIRAVGNPDVRFNEDALRILRALRFKGQLGFEIEPKTKAAIYKNYHLLDNIAGERINQELNQLIVSEFVDDVLKDFKEVIEFLVRQPIRTEAISYISRSLEVRYALLLSNSEIAHLKLDKKRTQLITFLIENRDRQLGTTVYTLLKDLSEFNHKQVVYLAQLQQVKIDHLLSEIKDKRLIYNIADLQIDGNQLIKMGYKQGPQIKVLLNLILEAVMSGILHNDTKSIQEWLIKQ